MSWMHFIATLPLHITVGAILALCVVVPCLAVWLMRRIWPHPALETNNEIVGFTYAVFGLIYGVLLAFTIIIAWERFSKTEHNVMNEVTTLSEMWRDAQAFNESAHTEIHKLLLDYTISVARDEWPAMAATGHEHPQTRDIYSQLWKQSYSLHPQSKIQEAYLTEYLHDLNDLSAARRMRIHYSWSAIPNILWLILLVGAVPTFAYVLLFSCQHTWVQVVLTGFIMLMVLLSLLVAASLQYPFTGDVCIGPDAFQHLTESFQQRLLQAGAAQF